MATAIKAGARDYAALISEGKQQLEAAGFRMDYLEVRRADNLRPVAANDRHVVILVALFVGTTRLIDNVIVDLPDEA